MPHDAGIFEKRMRALEDVEIGAADADRPDVDRHPARGCHRDRPLDQREPAWLEADDRLHGVFRPGEVLACRYRRGHSALSSTIDATKSAHRPRQRRWALG